MTNLHKHEYAPPQNKPPDAPDHPYWNPEYFWTLTNKFLAVREIFKGIRESWIETNGDIRPEELVDLFSYVSNRLAQQEHPIDHVTLYDVWNFATWLADADLHAGVHPEAPGQVSYQKRQQYDQIASLIEEAMDLAGHRPI